ncbi:MAG: lysophospholipid acyltransferase family protein [Alphaproteobacteria bacterium]
MGQDRAHQIISALITFYLRLVYITSRWDLHGEAKRVAFLETGEAYFILMWHARIAMMASFWNTKRWPLAAVASRHRDGQVVTRVMAAYGIKGLEVSSKLRSSAHVKAILRAVGANMGVVITPDGPRGPARTLKRSTIQIAKLSGARLTLATYAVKRRIRLKSWDNFTIPLPFNRGVVLWDRGLAVPKSLSNAQAADLRHQIETRLNDLTDRADRLMGHEPDGDRKQRRRKR